MIKIKCDHCKKEKEYDPVNSPVLCCECLCQVDTENVALRENNRYLFLKQTKFEETINEAIKPLFEQIDYLTKIVENKKQVRNKKAMKRLSKKEREYVISKFNNECKICGIVLDKFNRHIDHIIPVSKGGGNNMENLQLLCIECNLKKSNHILNKEKNGSC